MGDILQGDGSFGFVAEIEGDNLTVHSVRATWFGGPNDPNDSGRTASGVSTRDNPNLLGCALPMDGFGSPKTDGSPIPRLPWRTPVQVTNRASGVQRTFLLIDLGPSKYAPSRAAIDLTESAFRSLGGNPRDGIMLVDFVIPGGALHGVSVDASRSLFANVAAPDVAAFMGLRNADGHGLSHDIPKPVVKAFIESPNHASRNGVPIDMVVMHYTDGPTAQGAINRFLDPAQQVSAHYIIDRNGDVYQMVRDTDKAWHARAANRSSIGIEHVAVPGQAMAPAQLESSAALVRWLVATYEVDLDRIFGHRYAPGADQTDCPGDLFGPRTTDAVQAWVDANIRAA